ncbi:hypothetical protein DSM112329_02683 [Paraconexibacter sp. AEG42_29]|uniref:Tellurium resistance protein TerA n=1 Tax=Paraconexibacter sp. AEG42_29 TaxID=2997339 RepID=A0AAU7AVW4_9ACTN
MSIDYSKRPSKSAGGGGGGATPPPSGPISLTKRGEQVSLTKGGGGSGPVRINLNWDQQAGKKPAGKGFMNKLQAAAGGGGGIDLDLGCLFELTDGRKGVVQALGNAFGSLDGAPWILLDKDDRSGTATDGENLFISDAHSAQIARVAVFAFIYQGVKKWSEAAAVVTIHPPGGAPIKIELDGAQDGQGMCSICTVEGGNSGYVVQREVQYVGGHRDLDNLYGWGMNWTRGSK